jgi:hypothetical protein
MDCHSCQDDLQQKKQHRISIRHSAPQLKIYLDLVHTGLESTATKVKWVLPELSFYDGKSINREHSVFSFYHSPVTVVQL